MSNLCLEEVRSRSMYNVRHSFLCSGFCLSIFCSHLSSKISIDHPHGKEIQKSKMAVWGGLTNSCKKKRSKKQKSKGKIKASECRVPKNCKKR